MIYVLAAIGALTVAVLLWRAFGPMRDDEPESASGRRTVAPDDDPEFLRRLGEQQQRNTGDHDQD